MLALKLSAPLKAAVAIAIAVEHISAKKKVNFNPQQVMNTVVRLCTPTLPQLAN